MIKRLIILSLICASVWATTLSTLQTQVYRQLDTDTNNRVISSTMVRGAINDAFPDLERDAHCVIHEIRTPLVAKQESYFIDSSMVKDGVLDVYLKDMTSGKLEKLYGLSHKQSWEFGRTGLLTTDAYFITGFRIVLNAVPSNDNAGDTLIIKYADTPVSLDSANAVTDVPAEFHLALAFRACALIYGARQKVDMQGLYEGLYNGEISKKRTLNPPDTTQPTVTR